MTDFEEKFWELLEAEEIDLVTAPASRAERGEKFSLTAENLMPEIQLMAVRELLDRLAEERAISHALFLAYDQLRTKHAETQGRLALGNARVLRAAAKHKDASLAALARDTVYGEPKLAALARIPTATAICKAVEQLGWQNCRLTWKGRYLIVEDGGGLL